MSEIKLKPCPFCGGKVEIVTGIFGGITMIHCNQCERLFRNKETVDKAVKMWNRRV